MNFVPVGKIVKPQGIKGEVKVLLYSDSSDAIKNAKVFYMGKQKSQLNAKTLAIRFGFAYILFEGVNSRAEAEGLRNQQLFVERDDFELEENNFLISEVIGCKVYNQKNQLLGEIIDVEQYGAADVWSYRGAGRTYSFPYVADIVLTVDTKQKTVIVNQQKLDEAKI